MLQWDWGMGATGNLTPYRMPSRFSMQSVAFLSLNCFPRNITGSDQFTKLALTVSVVITP